MSERLQRESLEAPLLRHGDVEGISTFVEQGKKSPYELYVKFMRGEADPPVDEERTSKIIEDKIAKGELKKEDIDIIIHTPALRGQQTAELLKKLLGLDISTHASEYLQEVHMPMDEITPEFYEAAKDIKEVMGKFQDSFLGGKKVDEDVVDVYKRALTFLTYFRRIRKYTDKKPLFISHGIFSRFLNLAINHQQENLDDEQIRKLVQGEFKQTRRPGVVGGSRLESSKEGIKIMSVI